MNYTNIRDNTATRLMSKYGRTAILRKTASVYDPSTGSSTHNTSDKSVFLIYIPVRRQGSTALTEFSEDLINKFSTVAYVTADGTPSGCVKENDNIIDGGTSYTVLAVSAIAPNGTDIIYKTGLIRD